MYTQGRMNVHTKSLYLGIKTAITPTNTGCYKINVHWGRMVPE